MIETRWKPHNASFHIEAYDEVSGQVVGEYFLNKEHLSSFEGHLRFSGKVSLRNGAQPRQGIGSALLDRAKQFLTDYSTIKQKPVVHEVTISKSAPHYLQAMFEHRGYKTHTPKSSSRTYYPGKKDSSLDRLEKKVNEMEEELKNKLANLKKRVPFVN